MGNAAIVGSMHAVCREPTWKALIGEGPEWRCFIRGPAAPAVPKVVSIGLPVLPLSIEDTDAARSTRASEEAMLRDLKWLGLDWDEGESGRRAVRMRVRLLTDPLGDLGCSMLHPFCLGYRAGLGPRTRNRPALLRLPARTRGSLA